MARIMNGILGGFSNKVGEVIGQNYGGISTMRAMPKYVSNPKTQAQVEHRLRMAFAGRFFAPLSNVLNLSLWGGNPVYNGFNKAIRENLSNIVISNNSAIIANVEDIYLGNYNACPFADMELTATFFDNKDLAEISLQWKPDLYTPAAFPTDRPILFILQDLGNNLYTFIYADLLETQRDWGSFTQFVEFPLETTIAGSFLWAIGYTRYNVGIPKPDVSSHLRDIDWNYYYNKLRDRYGHDHIGGGGGHGGGGGGLPTITIPAHNIPAFKPARSFVDEVRGNHS